MRVSSSVILATTIALGACEHVRQDGAPVAEPAETVPPSTATTKSVPAPARSSSEQVAGPLEWSERRAVELVALPLSCIDRPHQPPRGRSYLYEMTHSLRESHESTLAFYGCSDWHSAVNSTWTMVKVLKDFPDAVVSGLIREKLDNHLSEKSLEGEVRFFEEVARPGFERPYGWAWLLKLYVELHTWQGDDAQRWASHLRPLAELLAGRSVEYLDHLSHPIRVGTHNNTAFSLDLILEYARSVQDERLTDAVLRRATEFYGSDRACAIAYEPSGSDFLSPCLAEAVLMTELEQGEALTSWLDEFLPAPDSPELQSLREFAEVRDHYLPEGLVEAPEADPEQTPADVEREQERRLVGAKSHLIGLAFVRAGALLRLADALPPGDPRVEVYRELATIQAGQGFENMYDADYFGTHWLASFAVLMLTAR